MDARFPIKVSTTNPRLLAYQNNTPFLPGKELALHSVKLPPGATVTMLGDSEVLSWHPDAAHGTVISLPARWQSAANRPSQLPCVFRLAFQ